MEPSEVNIERKLNERKDELRALIFMRAIKDMMEKISIEQIDRRQQELLDEIYQKS